MNFSNRISYLLVCLLLISISAVSQYEPSIVHYDNDNRLVYHSDVEGNRIMDFSYAGYKNGDEDIPTLSVVKTISPVGGDNSDHIQAAIDEVSAMSLNGNGHRGAILLQAGTYTVSKALSISAAGVVLRGEGEASTKIYATGTDRRIVLSVGTGDNNRWNNKEGDFTTDITSEFLPAGSRTFTVEDASYFSYGDNIIIFHPGTDNWLAALNYGETHGGIPWGPGVGDMHMIFNRFITRVSGNTIEVDVPIYHELDRSLSQAYIWKYTRSTIITECGVENLTIEVETTGSTDEDHPDGCIQFKGAEDCWAKDVTTKHFRKAGFWTTQATRISILDCSALEPHSLIDGGRRYNYCVEENSNNILVKGCHGTEGRHTFVTNAAVKIAGVVFTQCTSTGDHASSESHRHWGVGMLWDDITFSAVNAGTVIALYNRGSYGTSHGWGGTNLVAWNISAPGKTITVQQPPIGQNWAIGCDANITEEGPFNPHPIGYEEGTGENMKIQSLYEAQLEERTIHGVSPDMPGRLRAIASMDADGNETVKLDWDDIALDEDNYIVERSTDGGSTFSQIAQVYGNVETYSDTDVTGASLHYRVRATNSTGSSAWSNVVQPTGILTTAEDITDWGGTTIIGSNDANAWEGADAGSGSPDGEKISNLIDNDINKKYLVRDETTWIEVSVTSPAWVNAYTITSANDDPARDPKSWDFQAWDASKSSWVTLHSVVNNPSWDERLTEKTWVFENSELYSKFRLDITAINGDDQSLMQIAELEIWEIEIITSIDQQLDQSGLRIYPNPAKETINISFDEQLADNIQVLLYDVSGKLLKEKVFNSRSQIDISQLQSGLHILKVVTNSQTIVRKLVIE